MLANGDDMGREPADPVLLPLKGDACGSCSIMQLRPVIEFIQVSAGYKMKKDTIYPRKSHYLHILNKIIKGI